MTRQYKAANQNDKNLKNTGKKRTTKMEEHEVFNNRDLRQGSKGQQ